MAYTLDVIGKGEEKKLGFETLCVHGGNQQDAATGAICTPIHQAVTYRQAGIGRPHGFEYGRMSTPTREVLEKAMSHLEGYGQSVCFGSGIAASLALIHTLSNKDHIIFNDDCYGGFYRLTKRVLDKFGAQADFVDLTKPENLEKSLKPNTKLVFVETPTNPMLKLVDIKAMKETCERRGIPLLVDNTFLTAHFQKPKKFGADIVLNSLTKYYAGHNDVVGGSISSDDLELIENLRFNARATGGIMASMECFLALRGLKTLHLRMEQHNKNAQKVAEFLEGNAKVEKVHYPGLAGHPQHGLAKKQQTGSGGMVSFELKGGLKAAEKLVEHLHIWTYGESLGGVESLVSHPATMSHSSLPPEERKRKGITDGLLRLSVGIENADDLIAELENAIAKT
ncbi:MAG: PLP-dependent transferase [Candidatus Diapherotrites archaeon]|nr:PLP-dependent transferase [Candidatus Diapherotrites archaeon]